MLEKLNINWSAAWRKAAVGSLFAAAMGYTYVAGKKVDDAIDAKYPAPKDRIKTEEPS